jgi:hypothetical protein
VLSQIGREEKAAAADKVSPVVRHRASIAQMKAMGFAEPVIGPAPLVQSILRAERQLMASEAALVVSNHPATIHNAIISNVAHWTGCPGLKSKFAAF